MKTNAATATSTAQVTKVIPVRFAPEPVARITLRHRMGQPRHRPGLRRFHVIQCQRAGDRLAIADSGNNRVMVWELA